MDAARFEASTGLEGKTGHMQEPPQEAKKMKALVAIDGSDESFYALNWLLDHKFYDTATSSEALGEPSMKDSSMLTLLHVMEPLPHYAFPGGFVVESASKAQEQNAAKILSRASQLCNEKKVTAKTLTLEGDPKEKICEVGEQMNVDVIVVGSRGLGQIKRAFLGSVSDYCAHHAKCPVLIIKLQKQSNKK